MAHVLVVDDEKNIRIIITSFLQKAGHTTVMAEDAEEAQQCLQKEHFDIVISDIVLPRASGMELLQIVRTTTPKTQVILMTGEPTIETAAEAVRIGACDYLLKPVLREAVLRAVGTALKMKALDEDRDQLTEANRQQQQHLELVQETHQTVVKKEQFKAQCQIITDMIHDFNNILMPILGLPEHLLANPELLNDKAALVAMLQEMLAAARDARDTVRNLGEFCQPAGNPGQPHDAADRHPPCATPNTARKTRALHILVIDDKETSRRLLTQYLTCESHSVKTAESGPLGLEIFQRTPFDLIITNRSMPGMTGDEVAKKIRALNPDIPLIMITGYGDLMHASGEHPEGVDEIISKPVSPPELMDVIARATQKQTAERTR